MIRKLFRYYDYSLLATTLLLLGFGLIMVYSASSVWAVLVLGKSASYFFVRQSIWCTLALLFGFFGMLFPYQGYRSLVKPLVILSFILLALLYVMGKSVNNAQSWFSAGSVSFEPTEFVKMVLIFYLGAFFSRKQAAIAAFRRSVLPPLFVVLAYFVLVVLQPALGTALILLFISGVMILCSGLRTRHLIFLGASGAALVAAILFKFRTGYQSARFTAAYNPFAVAGTTGRQLINSYIAIASGGLTGKGLGNSIEKAGFLPEPHTDFIISIICEELGLIGVLFVICLIAYLVLKGFVIATRCQDTFGSLLAVGISAMLGIQTLINLGAATGMIPVTGVTLPFISYGGSSLIVMTFAVGVLMNISAYVNLHRKKSD